MKLQRSQHGRGEGGGREAAAEGHGWRGGETSGDVSVQIQNVNGFRQIAVRSHANGAAVVPLNSSDSHKKFDRPDVVRYWVQHRTRQHVVAFLGAESEVDFAIFR